MIIYGFGIYFHNMQKVTRRGKFSISVLATARLYKQDSMDFSAIKSSASYKMIHTIWFILYDSDTLDWIRRR